MRVLTILLIALLFFSCSRSSKYKEEKSNVCLDSNTLRMYLPHHILNVNVHKVIYGEFETDWIIDSFFNSSKPSIRVIVNRTIQNWSKNLNEKDVIYELANSTRKLIINNPDVGIIKVDTIRTKHHTIGIIGYHTSGFYNTRVFVLHSERGQWYQIDICDDHSKEGLELREQIPLIINSIVSEKLSR